MRYYAGPQKGDEKPTGGGSYNSYDIGHEAYNFKVVGGRLWGYFQPYLSASDKPTRLSTARIDPASGDVPELKHVLLIFVAKRPQGGQVVVGWYRDATVLRDFALPRKGMMRGRFHVNLAAAAKDSFLLPERFRNHAVPTGKNAMGQANACYVYDGKGQRKKHAWIRKAIEYVENFNGPNLLTSPDEDIAAETADVVETHRAKQGGQGFAITPELKKKIEQHSVRKAKAYFASLKYSVEDVGQARCYDLHCTKKGSVLRVEVKGSQTEGKSIVLRPNEVESAMKHRTALFLLHSIKVDRKRKGYRVSGGSALVLNPWRIKRQGTMKPIALEYRLKGR